MTDIRQQYTREEVLKGLTVLALVAGSKKRAEEMLVQQGLQRINIATLRDWAYVTYRDDYERIKSEIDQHVRAKLADNHLALAFDAGEIEALALEKLRAKLENNELNGKELASVLSSSAVAGGVHTDKAQLLAGKPTQIVQNDFSELQRALLQRHGVRLTIEGEATEEPAPQIEEAIPA